MSSERIQYALVATLLLIFLAIGSLSVWGKALTYDEGKHMRYGRNLLEGSTERFDDSKMPVSALNALPNKLATFLPEGFIERVLDAFFTARMVTFLFSMLVAWLVFYWSRSLYGVIPGIVSLFLYVFDPNIIAHSQLVTTDLYAWGTIALAFFCLWRFTHQRTLLNGLLCAFVLGLSMIAKYTSVVLLPLFLITLFLYDFSDFSKLWQADRWRSVKEFGARYFLYMIVAIVISIFVINIGFLFNKTFTPFGNYEFRSQTFQSLQSGLPWLEKAPIPTPYPYLEGLDWVMRREQTGDGYGSIYLLGQLRNGRGFKGYYFIAYLLKVPIATQIVVLGALIKYIKDRSWKRLLSDEVFLFAPILFFGIYFNFFFNAQIGIRFYLVLFPFLYVFAGSLFSHWREFALWQKVASYGLGMYLIVSVLAYFPHYIPYFNEFVWDKRQAYKYLADSNLDWRQNKFELDKYMAEHPDASFPRAEPAAGHYVVSANRLVGVNSDPAELAWLRENFEPVDTVAYSYLIFKVSQQKIETLCQITSYCEY
ncbi:MAG: glycosyltransferase family 39 protein [Anaerolineales bacterium]